MDDFSVFLGGVIMITCLICFFVLCKNVAVMKRKILEGTVDKTAGVNHVMYWQSQYEMHKSFGERRLAGEAARKMVWYRYKNEVEKQCAASAKNYEMEQIRKVWQPEIEEAGCVYPVFKEFV